MKENAHCHLIKLLAAPPHILANSSPVRLVISSNFWVTERLSVSQSRKSHAALPACLNHWQLKDSNVEIQLIKLEQLSFPPLWLWLANTSLLILASLVL